MAEKEVKIIEDRQEINKIIEEKIKGRKLVFTKYYYFGIDIKGIPHEKVQEIFPQFDKVFAIETETLKLGDLGYELFYKLSNNVSFSIATLSGIPGVVSFLVGSSSYKPSCQSSIPSPSASLLTKFSNVYVL